MMFVLSMPLKMFNFQFSFLVDVMLYSFKENLGVIADCPKIFSLTEDSLILSSDYEECG